MITRWFPPSSEEAQFDHGRTCHEAAIAFPGLKPTLATEARIRNTRPRPRNRDYESPLKEAERQGTSSSRFEVAWGVAGAQLGLPM